MGQLTRAFGRRFVFLSKLVQGVKEMRISLVVLFAVNFVVFGFTFSSATVNPDPDEIGIYFDLNADTVCSTVAPHIPFSAYIIITNPSTAEIWAIEFSLCVEIAGGSESMLFRLGEFWSAGFFDFPMEPDWCLDGRAIGFSEPIPQVGDNAVLVRLQYLLLSNIGVEFFLGPHPVETIEDGLPAYGDGDGGVVPLNVSSGDPGLPVAAVNGPCDVVPVVTKSFSGLKCLYR